MSGLSFNGVNLGELCEQLTAGRFVAESSVHLDPDLDFQLSTRKPGWRPSLGQLGAAQTHLRNNNVGPGDVFLFFGWFREIERHSGLWRYAKSAQGRHVMFGWLQVGEILDIANHRARILAAHPWLIDHPHFCARDDYADPRKRNTIYLAGKNNSIVPALAGGGMFPHYQDALCLTWPGRSRSQWRLPGWMSPINDESSMTYHPVSRWTVDKEHVLLKSAAKGQEFVFDADRHPQAEQWLRTLLVTANEAT